MKFVAIFVVLIAFHQTLADMPIINPNTNEPYTAEEIIASAASDGALDELNVNDVYKIYGNHKQPTGPILISDYLPRPKKMPPRSTGHVCTVEKALSNAPRMKTKPFVAIFKLNDVDGNADTHERRTMTIGTSMSIVGCLAINIAIGRKEFLPCATFM
uniref:Uncharacterized protein n=1 Tax=Mayetiola destructor TaxID=39758 RepID=F6KPR8_MAYDE|nr:hypothetical protein [Mayetiola destructor]